MYLVSYNYICESESIVRYRRMIILFTVDNYHESKKTKKFLEIILQNCLFRENINNLYHGCKNDFYNLYFSTSIVQIIACPSSYFFVFLNKGFTQDISRSTPLNKFTLLPKSIHDSGIFRIFNVQLIIS